MAPHHDEPGRRHPLQEYGGEAERPPFQEHMDRVEMGENSAGSPTLPMTWATVKELAYVIGLAVTLAGGYYDLRGEIRDSRRDVVEVAARVAIIEKDRAEKIPRLEEQIRLNALQDQRIQNLTEALSSLRTTVTDLARIVAGQADLLHDADKRAAVLEERLGHGLPHDR